MAIATINPTTGETLRTFDAFAQNQLESKLQLAYDTFQSYRRSSFDEREPLMLRAAQLIEDEKRSLAELMTTEMGKPFKAAVGEAEKCSWVCRYYAEMARQFLADELVSTEATKSYVRFEPVGPV